MGLRAKGENNKGVLLFSSVLHSVTETQSQISSTYLIQGQSLVSHSLLYSLNHSLIISQPNLKILSQFPCYTILLQPVCHDAINLSKNKHKFNDLFPFT